MVFCTRPLPNQGVILCPNINLGTVNRISFFRCWNALLIKAIISTCFDAMDGFMYLAIVLEQKRKLNGSPIFQLQVMYSSRCYLQFYHVPILVKTPFQHKKIPYVLGINT